LSVAPNQTKKRVFLSQNPATVIIAMPSGWGGTEVNTLLLAERLLDRGHEVTLMEVGGGFYANRMTAARRKIPVIPLPTNLGTLSLGIPRVQQWVKLLRQYRATHLVLAKSWVHTRIPALDVAALWLRLRYSCVEHHPAHFRTERWSELAMIHQARSAQWLQRLARSRVICVSHTTLVALRRFERLPLQNAAVVYPGIPWEVLHRSEVGRRRVREQYRIPADAFVVGSIGRLEPIKRHDEAFRIFASLGSETAPSEPHFLLVGSGGDESSLRHLAQALGIANRVHFCGFVPDESRADYYSAMDCFLMVSKAEGLGMTLIEAMACECPVVATNSGGPSEVLIREDLGWLVPQDDWGRVRAAVEAAQAMPSAHRQRRVEAAREFVVSRFDSNTQNDILATLIEQA